MRHIFGSTRYANVTATLALMVALGGTSYAAVALPRNSVGSRQLRRGAVRSRNIRRNAVGSSKVQNGSLLQRDFKSGQLPTGAPGSRGPQGPRGLKGDRGVPGAAGTARAFANVSNVGVVDASRSQGIAQANVGHPSTGAYCFSGIDFTPRSVVANVDILNGGGPTTPIITTNAGANIAACPVGTQAAVEISSKATDGTQTPENRGFYVLIN